MYTGIFFLDLKKAFDTVSHKILLTKLEHYGIRGTAYSLTETFRNQLQCLLFLISIAGITGMNIITKS